MCSVCRIEQQQTSEKRPVSRSNTSKCTIKSDVQHLKYKQLSKKQAYDQIQENRLLHTCVHLKYSQNICVSSIQELLGTTVKSI